MIRKTPESLAAKFDAAATEARQEAVTACVAGDQVTGARRAGEATALSLAAEAMRHNLTETPDERRERFESWIRSRYPTTADVLLEIRDGEYWHAFTHAAYMGWTMAGAFIPNSEEKS